MVVWAGLGCAINALDSERRCHYCWEAVVADWSLGPAMKRCLVVVAAAAAAAAAAVAVAVVAAIVVVVVVVVDVAVGIAAPSIAAVQAF